MQIYLLLQPVNVDSTGVAQKSPRRTNTGDRAGAIPAMIYSNPTKKKVRDRRAPTEVDLNDLPVQVISDRLYRLAEVIAEARKITYEPISGGKVYGEQGSVDANLTGVIGEIAVQKATGRVEQPIFLRGDRGYDLVHNDRTIDVKTTATHMDVPDLLIPADQELRADVYLLAHRFEPRTVRLVGWAPRRVVKDREPERHPGSSLNYVIRPDELTLLFTG